LKQLSCLLLALSLLLTACGSSGSYNKPPSSTPTKAESVSVKLKTTEQDAAIAIMLALKQRNLDALASYIHPEKGLLLSPYLYIQSDAVVFKRDELPAFSDTTLYSWGKYDGSGEPITLSFSDYYKQFIYDKPFYEAEQIAYNEIINLGNMTSNIAEKFPGSFTADFHFSGFDQQVEGMDWESLILVIENFNGFWYVSAIIHSQWTI